MKYFSLIGLLLLVGCEKHKSIASIVSEATGGSVIAGTPKTVLIMGQSNAVRLAPAGYKGFNDVTNAQNVFYNCAENGTTLAQWGTNGSRMANCLAMTQGIHIDVILWYQGESDANPVIGGFAFDYAQKLTSLFAFFRTKWGAEVPIVFAQIAVVDINKLPDFTNWQEVKDQQASIFYPHTIMIKTDDIIAGNPLSTDGIHFDDPGDYEVGARMARAYGELL